MSDPRRTLFEAKKEKADSDWFHKVLEARLAEADAGDDPNSWKVRRWAAAEEAMRNGTWKPKPPTRYPVILNPDGPISSASQLQTLAETEGVPNVTTTTRVARDGKDLGEVTISDVSLDELEKMEEKAEVNDGIRDDILVIFLGKGGLRPR